MITVLLRVSLTIRLQREASHGDARGLVGNASNPDRSVFADQPTAINYARNAWDGPSLDLGARYQRRGSKDDHKMVVQESSRRRAVSIVTRVYLVWRWCLSLLWRATLPKQAR